MGSEALFEVLSEWLNELRNGMLTCIVQWLHHNIVNGLMHIRVISVTTVNYLFAERLY